MGNDKMNTVLFVMSAVTFCQGFLLDNSNTSSVVKQTYLTVAEYYGDKSQLQNEIDANHNQQVANRNQQDRALKLLVDQLQQRLLSMEQKMTEKIECHQQSAHLSDQKYKELETKYTAMKGTVDKWEQKYQKLEQNYTQLNQNYNELEHEIQQLKQLKSVNQLQSLSQLAENVKTFDSKISVLNGHEQSRNQDFLALYNLTTSTLTRLKQIEAEYNTSFLTLQQAGYNFTSRLDMLANATSSINQSQNMSLRQLQQTIEENNKKVLLTGCQQKTYISYSSWSAFKFPTVVTEVGIPDLTTFTSTGKFVCPVNGIYYISAVLTPNYDSVPIDIMKNSVSMHHQYINGNSHNNWEPGTAIIALELNVNDTVWIKTNHYTELYYSCITIFKL